MAVSLRIPVLLGIVSLPAWASAIVNTSLSLTTFQILPASGSVNILSPVNALVFAQAQDSLGGLDQNFNSVNDMATSTSAATSLADASAAASAATLTGSASANANVPSINGFGASEGQVTLSGMFEIMAPGSSVNVTVAASLLVNQFLDLDAAGLSASSEVTYTLTLPDLSASPVLSYDNLLSAGPDQTISNNLTQSLSASLDNVPTNTPLFYVSFVDTETPPAVSMSPEPSALLLTSAAGLTLIGRHLWRRSTKQPR